MNGDLYDAKPRTYFNIVKHQVLDRLDSRPLGHVLDVGGGDGATSAFLLDKGLATSAQILDPYTRSPDTPTLKFSTESADDLETFERMKLAGCLFDTVMFLDVLEHLVDPWATLRSVRSVHKDGGRLIICMPNARHVRLVVPLVFLGRFDYKPSGIMDRTHIRWFTRSTLMELVETAGYRVDRIDAFIPKRSRIANLSTIGLFRRFFEYQYIIQATK